jgi:hypothetical protein
MGKLKKIFHNLIGPVVERLKQTNGRFQRLKQ